MVPSVIVKDRTFAKRMCPPLENVEPKPEEVKCYTNKKNWWTAVAARKRYFEGSARDPANPHAESAKARKTCRFAGLLQHMDDARKGKAYFHDPASHGSDKGKGKGEQMTTTERWI
eukprot:8551998-Lingulodinium_polyedra.AAC.1